MAWKKITILCLAMMSGLWAEGCQQSVVMPSAVSLPGVPADGVPAHVRLSPPLSSPSVRLSPGRPHDLPIRWAHPWKPKVRERAWKHIVIHHTATWRGSVASIHATHRNRRDKKGNRWLGIGYHFVIGNGHGMADGAIEPTFRWRQQLHGAHAGDDDFNQNGIGIAMVGNFNEGPPTIAQMKAIKRLVAVLKANYRISADKVVGHNEVKATACPGIYFPLAEVSRVPVGTLLGGDSSRSGVPVLASRRRN